MLESLWSDVALRNISYGEVQFEFLRDAVRYGCLDIATPTVWCVTQKDKNLRYGAMWLTAP